MDGWNTILSYWGPGLFSGANLLLVSGRVFPTCWTFDPFLDQSPSARAMIATGFAPDFENAGGDWEQNPAWPMILISNEI